MAERLRSVTIVVEVDTNKRTVKRTLTWEGEETIDQLQARVVAAINDALEEFDAG